MKRVFTLFVIATATFAVGATSQEGRSEQQTQKVVEHWSPYEYPMVFPPGAKVYIIVSGDTLWDISERTYNNPLLWPQIFSANSYIGDPHWIYPGDPLVLPDLAVAEAGRVIKTTPIEGAGEPGPEGAQPPESEAGAEGEEQEPTPTAVAPGLGEGIIFDTQPLSSRDYAPIGSDLDLYCSPVLYSSIPETDLWVAGLEEKEQVEAFNLDIVYLNRGRDRVRPGDMFVASVKVGVVRNPNTNVRVGYAYQEVGIISVIIAGERHAVGEIIHACDGLRAGAILLPYVARPNPVVRTRRRMQPLEQYQVFDDSVVGTIVYANNMVQEIGVPEVVNIDIGSADGVKIGDRYLVFRDRPISRRHRDYRAGKLDGPDQTTVRRVLGEAIILRVMERTACAKISYTNDFINLGDFVALAKPLTVSEGDAPR